MLSVRLGISNHESLTSDTHRDAYMEVPRNSADSRSSRTHPSVSSESFSPLALLKDGDIHLPFHGRLGSANEEPLGTTKLFERPKSTILNLRSAGVVPVRTTFYVGERRGHGVRVWSNIETRKLVVGEASCWIKYPALHRGVILEHV